jgi:hypothetical protein
LCAYLNQPGSAIRSGRLDPYFLWAVERVGVVYNLPWIANVNWYRWGVGLLLPAQRRDGSWYGANPSRTIDTAMALLFLRRANPMPDLTAKVQRYMVVTAPVVPPRKGPQKVDVWLHLDDMEQPPILVSLREAVGAGRAKDLVTVMLGEAKLGTQTEWRITVRSAVPFRITAIKGTDKHWSAENDAEERKPEHVLTIRLQPNEPGELTRRLRLLTDLPNGGAVEFNVKAQVVSDR